MTAEVAVATFSEYDSPLSTSYSVGALAGELLLRIALGFILGSGRLHDLNGRRRCA